jgi:hypothetical protein
LDICHIESSVSQLSLFSLFSTISLLWTQFWASIDTKQTPRRQQNRHPQRQNQVYQMRRNLASTLPYHRAKVSFPVLTPPRSRSLGATGVLKRILLQKFGRVGDTWS